MRKTVGVITNSLCKKPQSLVAPKLGKHHNGQQNASYASYRVDHADAVKTMHEQSQVNPLLPKNNSSTFQHPAIVRSVCELNDCQHKLCDKPCTSEFKDSDVGHLTHSGTYPKERYVSGIDCSGNTRPEFAVPYDNPVENTTGGQNVDCTKTTNLNNNKEALHNVHMNSSRKPVQSNYSSTND